MHYPPSTVLVYVRTLKQALIAEEFRSHTICSHGIIVIQTDQKNVSDLFPNNHLLVEEGTLFTCQEVLW